MDEDIPRQARGQTFHRDDHARSTAREQFLELGSEVGRVHVTSDDERAVQGGDVVGEGVDLLLPALQPTVVHGGRWVEPDDEDAHSVDLHLCDRKVERAERGHRGSGAELVTSDDRDRIVTPIARVADPVRKRGVPTGFVEQAHERGGRFDHDDDVGRRHRELSRRVRRFLVVDVDVGDHENESRGSLRPAWHSARDQPGDDEGEVRDAERGGDDGQQPVTGEGGEPEQDSPGSSARGERVSSPILTRSWFGPVARGSRGDLVPTHEVQSS